ncbi:hypothetical protein CkaCkLH20_05634 [Colletotrichum karsti]|uniref:Uncharacterized protein n=1 Tax=Colletotrichum karsti TaxID=1095194 RepID=A0A9P6I3R8_9PEZI|nr:uncharacterized protein CkaCkLH20_05634 [Colletotrichum karsti]KAF9876788.1 hypothetical protein CkaCkLH20_05634 [Colletotrichum karsti]
MKSLKLEREVPFPSWSWMGWRGALTLTIEDKHADAGLASAVDIYILRNPPLRLLLARRIFMDSPRQVTSSPARGSSAVSLEDLRNSYPRINLEEVPDDQLLLFWSESTRLRVAKPIKSTYHWHERDGPLHKHREECYRQQLLDPDGNIAGQTGPCLGSQDAGNLEDKEYEFIVIAERTAPPDYEKQRIALQVERRPDGVAYRVNIAEISQDAWEKATKSHGLIALGSEI